MLYIRPSSPPLSPGTPYYCCRSCIPLLQVLTQIKDCLSPTLPLKYSLRYVFRAYIVSQQAFQTATLVPVRTRHGTNERDFMSRNVNHQPCEHKATFRRSGSLLCPKQRREDSKGRYFKVVKPDGIATKAPVTIKRPAFNQMRKMTLQALQPCILYVQYACRQRCRSLGICIHYQFVIGVRNCPDGLRCDHCIQSKTEQVRGTENDDTKADAS